ncbi:universal stress protein [Oleiagrimonas sp.]|jgi:nucleotide-binding universal stress UspA family protein|uniref:universal stress protein n=1 Tax=Oleiagrimonas sp. TaxID=2010330 RepID=UPI00260370E0|nr:universal stress protein [Oleiagrimonas sp.]MDA3913014.1 universal stress protein [Oleiagrimonas sp.]
MYKHILSPTDGSELSMHAVDVGVGLARTCDAKIHAIHVLAPFAAMLHCTEIAQIPEATHTAQVIAKARQILGQVRQRAKMDGTPFEAEFLFAPQPANASVELAATPGCDLIVMGSHGRGGLHRLLLGSQTCKVVQQGDLPVRVCK